MSMKEFNTSFDSSGSEADGPKTDASECLRPQTRSRRMFLQTSTSTSGLCNVLTVSAVEGSSLRVLSQMLMTVWRQFLQITLGGSNVDTD